MIWLYWLLGTLCYYYLYILRTLFGTLGEDITTKFDLSVTDLSTFFAAAMISYSLMQIPAGILLDKFGPRKMLSIAMLCLSSGVLIISLTHSLPLAIFGRILMGVGSAFGFIGTSKIVTVWFPLKMMGFLLGATVFLGGLGGAFSRQLYDALPHQWDVSQSLLSLGIAGVFLAGTIAFFLREKTHMSVGSAGAVPVKKTTFVEDLRVILTNKQILTAALFTFFGYLPISIIGDSWGPSAFQKMFDASKETADQTLMYFYVAFALGSLFYSSIVTTLSKIRSVLFVEFSFALFFIYILLAHPSIGQDTFFGIPGFLILCSLIGFNLGGVALAFPIGCSHASKEISATVVGVMNMFCMISGGIFSKVVGHLLHLYWDGTTAQDGTPIFSGAAYQSALKPLIFTTVLALVLLVFIRAGKEEVSLSKA